MHTDLLQAGVSHCNLESKDDYSYVGLYPEGSPKYDNNWGKADSDETAAKAANARAVPLPDYDPVHGKNGPLCHIWAQASIGSLPQLR